MPELPEVETTLQGIKPHIENQVIENIIIRHHQLRWPIPFTLPQELKGKSIHKIIRRGKYLLLCIDDGALIIHLGMSGHLRILTHKTPPKKHDHVDIEFENKKVLRFNDTRRFGAVLWIKKNPDQHFLLAKLGPEPLTPNFNSEYLWKRARTRKVSIKSFIMDSHIVVGVGNIYAAEALFLAGIHPAKSAKSISLERMEKLVAAIKKILEQAIQKGGTTFRDFVNSEGKPGYFANKLNVYGRENLNCIKCDTKLLMLRIGQRSTVYCKKCQK